MLYDDLPDLPLAVDLDGTLTPQELPWVATNSLLRKKPWCVFELFLKSLHGRCAYKTYVCQPHYIPYAHIPLHPVVMACIRYWRDAQRRVCLATGTPESYTKGLVDYLGCFTDYVASTPHENYIGKIKAAKLNTLFGEKQYIYVGNNAVDFAVWKTAAVGVFVGDKKTYMHFLKKGAALQYFIPNI